MRRRAFLFSILVVALAVICTVFANNASDAPFHYDEADYMYAGTQGFAANYLDRNSMPLATYIRKGLELAHDKTLARKMSEDVRTSGDVSFYRHYHGPAYAYWIALWHDLGMRSNAGYRATGLVVHALESVAIFWLFLLAFPDLPEVAALVAALMFAMNRTALPTAAMITQHLIYSFVACLALFAVALYVRTRERRYWYAAAALLAVCFATVEISPVLIGVVVLSVGILDWRDGWKRILALIAKGAACFAVVLAIIWPPGVFELNALKGYAYLAYIAIARKTFTPIGPRELWVLKLKTQPLELILPLATAIVAIVLWRRLADKRALTPFLLYGCAFFGVTLVITVPYFYYHCSMMMSFAVVTGVMFGELWKRGGIALRAASLALVLGSLLIVDVTYYGETVRQRSEPPTVDAVSLAYLDAHPVVSKELLAPWILVPTLHYYHPDTRIIGYDPEGNLDQLTEDSSSAAGAEVYCPESVCRQLEAQWRSGRVLAKEPIPPITQETQPWYAISVANR